MTDISAIRHEIAERVRTISGLNVLDHWPDNLTGVAAVVQPARDPFMLQTGYGPTFDMFFDVILLVPFQTGGDVRAQQALDSYLDPSGERSIWEALEGTNGAQRLEDEVSDLVVMQVHSYGALWTIGTTAYMGVSWRVKAMV